MFRILNSNNSNNSNTRNQWVSFWCYLIKPKSINQHLLETQEGAFLYTKLKGEFTMKKKNAVAGEDNNNFLHLRIKRKR